MASSSTPVVPLLTPSSGTTEGGTERETPQLVHLADRVSVFVRAAKAGNTLRAYQCDWEDFVSWCSVHQQPSMPAAPDTVALYIADLAGSRSTATIMRRLTSIARIHEMAGHPSPATMRHAIVSETLKGIRRTNGIAQKGKLPLLTADLQKLLAHLPDNLRGVRDRALLLVGFAGAFRRSEPAGFEVDQVEFNADGLVLALGKSKTDQEGKGENVAIPFGSHQPTCPVRALRNWWRGQRFAKALSSAV